MNREEFYKNETRKKSRELDFGVWWRDGRDWPTYRVTWVADTGEVVAVNNNTEDYQILGKIRTEELVEEQLKGWAEICGNRDSLDWVRRQL